MCWSFQKQSAPSFTGCFQACIYYFLFRLSCGHFFQALLASTEAICFLSFCYNTKEEGEFIHPSVFFLL